MRGIGTVRRVCLRFASLAVAICTLSATAYASEWIGGDIYRGSGEKVVALTFDDGPDETKTDEILDVLERHGVKATFFMIGKNAELYPDVAARVIAAGHEVGNHTYSHEFLSGNSLDEIRREFSLASDVIFAASEYKAHFLRPPGGIYDGNVIDAAKRDDLVIAMWTIDTLDWCHRSAEEISREVLENVRGGDVILMHDYVWGKSHTKEALETIIPALKERGYEFVTLSDMYLNHRD